MEVKIVYWNAPIEGDVVIKQPDGSKLLEWIRRAFFVF